MKRKPELLLIYIGILFVLISACFFGYQLWDDARVADVSAHATEALYAQIASQPTDDEVQGLELDGEVYMGILSIPSLGLELPINNEWSYPKLKVSPCRYSGDISDSLVIAAHNYKNHFGNISKLEYGDVVTLTEVNGNKLEYLVQRVVSIDAEDIEGMTDSPYALTLFTCTYGGGARLAVRLSRAR